MTFYFFDKTIPLDFFSLTIKFNCLGITINDEYKFNKHSSV